MKNKTYLISIILILLFVAGVVTISMQNSDKGQHEDNLPIIENVSNKIDNNLTNDSNLKTKNDLDKGNKTTSKKDNEFKIPKGAKLTLVQAQKIANDDLEEGMHAEVVDCYKYKGDYYWSVIVYDKKTGETVGGFAISDKYKNLELM